MPPALIGGVTAADCAGDIADGGDINPVGSILAAPRTDRHPANITGSCCGADKLIGPGRAGDSRGRAVNTEPGGPRRRQLVIKNTLLLGAVNLLEVADTAFGPTGFAGLNKVWDSNGKQYSNNQHDNHNFNECKSAAHNLPAFLRNLPLLVPRFPSRNGKGGR